jgi:hypothetical protein
VTVDIEEYTQIAIRQAAITLQWQATDASGIGNGYPISQRGDEYTDDVAKVPYLIEAVTSFVADNWETLQGPESYPEGAEQAGHDLILTANRHGAGFWDRGLGATGKTLTDAAHFYSFDAEFELWGDRADGDEHCADEVAWLMVENTVIVDDLGYSA